MFGLKPTLYLVYVRRKRHDLYDDELTSESEPTAGQGLFGLRYQPHHLCVGVFDNLREAAKYANELLIYRKTLGVPEGVFQETTLPDKVVEYRWPTGRHEFEAIGIMVITKRSDGRPHQPTADEQEASELIDSVENTHASVPQQLTKGGRAAILGGAPLNRDWVYRDGIDWTKPLDADARRTVERIKNKTDG